MKIDRFWLCGPRAKQRKSLFGGDLSPRQCEARVSEPTPISSLGEQMFATSVRNYLATANMAHGLLADWLAVLDNGTGKIFKFSSYLLLPLTLLEGSLFEAFPRSMRCLSSLEDSRVRLCQNWANLWRNAVIFAIFGIFLITCNIKIS